MAAQHWGNCQICGREHKVSGAFIAKHGYTIRNGWQEGECYGGRGYAKPIQLSCDLIQGAMDGAKAYVERTKEEIAQLTVNPLFDGGTVNMLIRTTTKTGETYQIQSVTVELNDKGEPVARNAHGKVVKTWASYTGIKTVADAATELANMRIGYLSKTIDQAEESIAYLADRLKNWTPTDMRPIAAADRAAEAPKVHMEAKRYGYTATLCTHSAMAAQKASSKRKAKERAEVTCAACLKELEALDALPAKQVAENERRRTIDIKSLERDIKDYQKWLKTEADPMLQLSYTETIVQLTGQLEVLKAQ